MSERWRLERAGLVNFWYYHDEAEFCFSDGKLILRGANGSGKSVTMQSFLPLVLDGDKRPWRLDPFGSKDRKIEYYLLLEENSGITDRTGYLYLEFYHPGQDRYLTVGIGLRARRNVSGMGFWGFAVTDNRRIGRDIFLYERDFSQGEETKIPITKNRLEEIIGQGGKVETEPGEYKKMVNNLLFGYPDLQSYQELLDLMIQLRSPKLSKDFKPSTIYGILTDALPRLQEDELRPLAEVLEDMDQISDRLEELAVHRKEAEIIDRAYNTYNEYLLYAQSQQLLDVDKSKEDEETRHAGLKTELQNLFMEITGDEERLESFKREREQAQTQLDVIYKSKAVEKQDELDRLKADEKNVQKEIESASQRKIDWERRLQRSKKDEEQFSQEYSTNAGEQQQAISAMECYARDSEFLVHDYYHRQWEKGIEARDPVWEAWKRDIGEHGQMLQEALETARQEARLAEKTEDAERELSAAREQRDNAERELRQAEQEWEVTMQEQQDRIFSWRKELNHLSVSDEVLQETLHLLTRYPEISYEDITLPVREAFNAAYNELAKERVEVAQRRQNHIENEKELSRQWQEWKEHKEPEPLRNEARERSRARRLAAGEKGVPLFAVCEFRDRVSDELKATLESALDRAGLLDAWLSSGKVAVTTDEEEIWIEPQPDLLAHTLADYLYPTPPVDGAITAEFIDQVLRTIRIGECEEGEMKPVVSESGRFRLGPLTGQAPGKARAEFIGKETRRLTRLAEMARLETLIQQEEDAICSCEEILLALADKETALKQELNMFPTGDALYQVNSKVEQKKLVFNNTQKDVDQRNTHYRQIHSQWLEVRNKLYSLTESWSIAKNERGISGALNSIRAYQESYSELKSLWTASLSLIQSLERAEREFQEASEKVEEENDYLEAKENQARKIRDEIDIYHELLQEMGILDIHRQIDTLNYKKQELDNEIVKCDNALSKKKIAHGVLSKEVEKSLDTVNEKKEMCMKAMDLWLKEWNRRLAPGWQEEQLESDGLKMARRIRQQCRGKYEQKTRENITNGLFDSFHHIRQTLHEYSPEQVIDQETDRLLIVFMRDRQNPITPQHLLQELKEAEQEQRLLLDEKDRELYEQIILHSVGKAIRQKIYRAEKWVEQMNSLMQNRDTTSGLRLRLRWDAKAASNENELDTAQLVKYLKTDAYLLRDEHREQMINHFRSRISWAKRESQEHKETLKHWIDQLLDYRHWFRFTLEYEKGEQPRRELTDARFNVLSGGEKAMAMYIPLFAATYSRYNNSRQDAPKIISLDEAFAGVDDENMRDMFELLTQLGFDYIMTSQVLWGCYDTVPSLSIYEVFRPKDVDFVTLIRYHWNGYRRRLVDDLDEARVDAAAAVEGVGGGN